jgi:hypothetical protein
MLKNFISYPLCFIFLSAVLSCFGGEDVKTGPSSAASEKVVSLQGLQLLNCGNDLCRIDGSSDDKTNVVNVNAAYQVKGILIVDSGILITQNRDNVPYLAFQISGLDAGMISGVKYQYQITDNQGKNIETNNLKEIEPVDGLYKVYLNVGTLSSGLLSSSPFDNHYVNLAITDSDNVKHFASILFNIAGKLQNPLLITRDKDSIDNSPYYLFKPADKYLIDSLDIENLLPYQIKNDIRISVLNNTEAAVQLVEGLQSKIQLGECVNTDYGVDMRLFKYGYSTGTSFVKTRAGILYSVLLFHNLSDTAEQGQVLPITVQQVSGLSTDIMLNDLVLNGKAKVRMNIYASFPGSNKTVGTGTNTEFYDGISACQDTAAMIAGNCSCFYMYSQLYEYVKVVNTFHCAGSDSAMPVSFFTLYGSRVNNALQSQYKPDCGTVLNVSPSLVAYNPNSETLLGRYHQTITTLDINTYFDELQDNQAIGKTYMQMDPLVAATGTMDTDQNNTKYLNTFIGY